MRGDEERVILAFCTWLETEGWTSIQREIEHVDIVAERDGQIFYIEVKGRTSSPGLDVDTVYGQLLRRMRHPGGNARYGVVVPATALTAAQRVPQWVRERLQIEIYGVDLEGSVIVESTQASK